MKPRHRTIPLLLSIFALCAAAARAQEIQVDGRAAGADGQGISGARVELRPVLSRYAMGVREMDGAGELPPEVEVASGADGRFALAAPRAGMWTVTVRAAGSVPVRLPLLPLLEPLSLPDAVLRRDAAAGDFRVGGLEPGADCQVAVRRPGFAPAAVSPVRPPASGLRIVLRQGATATGLVVDEAGLPSAGAVVELVRGGEESLGRAAVAADGSFSLPRLPPGRAELRIERPGAAPFRRPGIDVPDGGTLDLGRILAPGGATLAGRVTDPAGHPLSGVAVWLRAGAGGEWSREPAATTDADGAFAVAGLPPGEELDADLCRASP